jgi:hypothetical protein
MLRIPYHLKKLADNESSNSLATKLRKKRFALFEDLVADYVRNYQVGSVLKIVDVGGVPRAWEDSALVRAECLGTISVKVTILNIKPYASKFPNLKCLVGDATDMREFRDKEFDIAFSNSVIEHVGNYDAQLKMSREIKRIANIYFLQTPNFYFPIEPHYLLPIIHFLPLEIKVWYMCNFDIRKRKKANTREEALARINSINLLTEKQLVALFPDSTLIKEKFLLLDKSFIVRSKT